MAFDNTVKRLRDGKATLRRARQSAPLELKILDLWRAQQVYVQIVGSRRQLMPWERPWNIMNDVRDAIVIKDGVVEADEKTRSVNASRSQWVRPHRWILQA